MGNILILLLVVILLLVLARGHSKEHFYDPREAFGNGQDGVTTGFADQDKN